MADLDSSEVRQRTSDIKEWIFEAVEKIGAPTQYIKRESGIDGVPVFQIIDGQIPLPEDLVHLEGVAYSNTERGPWIPVRKSTGIFFNSKPSRRGPNIIHTAPPHDPSNKAIDDRVFVVEEHQPMCGKLMTSQSQIYTYNGMRNLERIVGMGKTNVPEYTIKPGWIVINKPTGFIKIAYKSIPTDERGYPLIPDTPSYQEAIYWYVAMKLNFPKFLSGDLGGKGVKSAGNAYFYLQSQWNFYRAQAYAEAIMPTPDDMQNIKDDWNRLIPDYTASDTFFKNIGKGELTYNDYNNGLQ